MEELKASGLFSELELLNWERIQEELYNFKIVRNYWNLVFNKETLTKLLLSNNRKVRVTLGYSISELKSKEDIEDIEELATQILKKYIDLFYKKYARQFETKNLSYTTLEKQELLSIFEKSMQRKVGYIIQISKTEQDLIENIRKLVNDINKLYKEDKETLPRIYFDKHLYVPTLLKGKKIDKISPPGLEESEEIFVEGLRSYLKNNKDKFSNIEIYLLRNFSRSSVGFQLQWASFYPDFIMWIKKGEKQTIAFIDPKGLEHTKTLNDEKISFAGVGEESEEVITIKTIEKKLSNSNVRLESFILSITPYKDLIKGMNNPPLKEDYNNYHVLFLEDKDWPEKLLSFLVS